MDPEESLLSGVLEMDIEGRAKRLQLQRKANDRQPESEERDFSAEESEKNLSILSRALEDHEVFTDSENERLVVHRVVSGGAEQSGPVRISDAVLEQIRGAVALAPLHNPAALEGIEAMMTLFPELPHVAVFDTGFHSSMPERARRYALPDALTSHHPIRRFGYHGISHEFVAAAATEFLSPEASPRKLVSLHLGSGASAAAVVDGRCIDTSMGMTPLEGLVMGTRSGDTDPSISFYLARELGLELSEIERLYNEDSGLKGLCGSADMRTVQQRADRGDERAQFAIELYCYRICKTIGAYHVAMGGLDCLVFTAGVGENNPLVRKRTIDGLAALGVKLDGQANAKPKNGVRRISASDSAITALVVPTDEELHMARKASKLVSRQ